MMATDSTAAADSINQISFSKEDDKFLLFELFMKIGPCWTKIAKSFDGKSLNQIRNHVQKNANLIFKLIKL